MKRRTLFHILLAALATPLVAKAAKVEKPINEQPHYIRELYIEVTEFDGWDARKIAFRMHTHRFPRGTAENFTWEYSIPLKVILGADYIAAIGRGEEGEPAFKVLKDRGHDRNNYVGEFRALPTDWKTAPLVDDDWLIEHGFRTARNESYTSI